MQHARSLRSGDHSGLGKWCLDKGKGDENAAAKFLTEEIYAHYKDGPEYEYDVPLNRFMVDYDIKEFLVNHVGITSWDDLNNDQKKACYHGYPNPNVKLPIWDEIVAESY